MWPFWAAAVLALQFPLLSMVYDIALCLLLMLLLFGWFFCFLLSSVLHAASRPFCSSRPRNRWSRALPPQRHLTGPRWSRCVQSGQPWHHLPETRGYVRLSNDGQSWRGWAVQLTPTRTHGHPLWDISWDGPGRSHLGAAETMYSALALGIPWLWIGLFNQGIFCRLKKQLLSTLSLFKSSSQKSTKF